MPYSTRYFPAIRPQRFPLACLVVAMAAAWPAAGAFAQTVESPEYALALKMSPRLDDRIISQETRDLLPIHVRGDHISGQTNLRTTIEGNAQLRRGDTLLRADRMEYYQPEDRVKMAGNVRINRAGNIFTGSALDMKVEAFSGHFTDVRYQLLMNGAHGNARLVEFIDNEHSRVHDGNYTTCPRSAGDENWRPDWEITARELYIDQEGNEGVAKGAQLHFKGIALGPPLPSISFPLSDERKSGLLPPTIGISSKSGVEYSQPYYWNIAPNRDATFHGIVMGKRGVAAGGEFRYLEPNYSGYVGAEIMPSDQLRHEDRWGLEARHRGIVDSHALPGSLSYAISLNRVSDDNYWQDFSSFGSRSSNDLTQRLLSNDFSTHWSLDEFFSSSLLVQKWQTLQDIDSPIIPPYDRLPQWKMRYDRKDLAGLDLLLETEYTYFKGDEHYTRQADGKRSIALAQLGYPVIHPGWFLTPKVQLHTTHYEFDRPLDTGQHSQSRTLPTYSLDSGLVFEREAAYFGRDFRQTLEPRAFYTYTPYRNQNNLPNYDSAARDFNFASIYEENSYVGGDRIADNHLLTVGVTSRLYDPQDGNEAVKLGIAQRFRFKNQNVILPGEVPATDRLSDTLIGAGINWTPQWGFEAITQYNSKISRTERSTISARYNPGPYRTLALAYRLKRSTSEQIDLGWQWPLDMLWRPTAGRSGMKGANGRLYSVGRLNYSMTDKRVVDSIIGFEYESCCWIGRMVLERLQNTRNSSDTRLLFQIEFKGFTRLNIGADPINSLRDNVPGYTMLRDDAIAPSRFSNYE